MSEFKFYKHRLSGEVYSYDKSVITDLNNIEKENFRGKIINDLDSLLKLKVFMGELKEMTKTEVNNHLNPKISVEELSSMARFQRDSLLLEIDSLVTNPFRWEGLSDAQKEELKEYRTGLLNVPQQKGFPEKIVWPEKPDIL